jgi:16S rRNA G527 N7-methylase RsmG
MGNFNLSLLIEGLTYLKLNYSEKQLKQFATYIKEINFFNATYKLVGSDEKEFIVKHLLDSLTPLKVIESLLGSQNTICDIGSGGGLLGLQKTSQLRPAWSSVSPFLLNKGREFW